ncbi:MAG: NAD(P)/FAD-dependent oxidoreductase, partial [Actinobacteria bacterium]|nr:NAD(P)/FAD-dependent oxidoreductase [Actinomycetota bacterium]
VAIIGAGPAGLAAAVGAHESGAGRILVIDREKYPGGILQQCIHTGFGLKKFKKELTGPEYAHAYIEMVKKKKIDILLDTFVYSIGDDRSLLVSNSSDGIVSIKVGAVVMAMGCREGTRGSISIPGYRPAGIFTAGTAQRLINIDGLMVGKKIVILGSGDIGLIMARRCTLEGAKVEAVVEKMPYPGGLNKNIVQCIDDYGIPLLLSSTVTFIDGRERVRGVEIAGTGSMGEVLDSKRKYIECDTLLLSIGLVPENELSKGAGIALDPVTGGPFVDNMMHTERQGFFAGGNVVQVYDLVDHVSEDSHTAGFNAGLYAQGSLDIPGPGDEIIIEPGRSVRSIVPRRIRTGNGKSGKNPGPVLSIRAAEPFTCEVRLSLSSGGKNLADIRRPYAVPSEMIRLDISKYEGSIAGIKRLRVDIEEVS